MLRTTPILLGLATLTLASAACTVSNPAACGKSCDDDADAGGTEDIDGDGMTMDADGNEAGSGDADAGSDAPPTVGQVEVDGTTTPETVDRSRVVELQVTAGDDHTVAAVEFFDGDTSIGQATNTSGDVWTLEWAVVGETFDGTHSLTATATDDMDQSTAGDPTTLDVDVPAGGSLVWEVANTMPEVRAEDVVLFGQNRDLALVFGRDNSGEILMYAVHAADGTARSWQDDTFNASMVTGGSARCAAVSEDGQTIVVGGYTLDENSDRDAYLAWYDLSGNEVHRWQPNAYPAAWQDSIAGVGITADGTVYAALVADVGGRLLRFEPDGTPDGEVLLSASPSAMVLEGNDIWTLGRLPNNTPRLARHNLNMMETGATETVFGSTALAVEPNTERIFVAGFETSSVGRLSAYDYDLDEQWSEPFFGQFSTTEPLAVASNPAGQAVVVGRGEAGNSILVATFDGAGDELWTVNVGEIPGISIPTYDFDGITTDPAGHVFIAGERLQVGGGPSDAALVRLEP